MIRRYIYLMFVMFLCSSVSSEKVLSTAPCQRGNFGSASLHEVRITPCPEANARRPCILRKGSNVTIEIDFTPTVAANKIVSRAYWANRMIELPLPNMNTNGCEFMSCPVQPNRRQTFRYILHVNQNFPSRRYDVRWKLTSTPFNFCLQFPIQIVN